MIDNQFLKFGSSIYFIDASENGFQVIYGKGFMDTSLYLSLDIHPECEFIFEQKRRFINQSDRKSNKSTFVIFGTEVLIRHTFSGFYLSVNKNEHLQLKHKEDQSCYFELLPMRTFEHKGDFIHLDSVFLIRNAHSKCYISSDPILQAPLKMIHPLQKIKSQKPRYKQSQDIHENHKQLNKQESAISSLNQSFCIQNESETVNNIRNVLIQQSIHREMQRQRSAQSTPSKLLSKESLPTPQIQMMAPKSTMRIDENLMLSVFEPSQSMRMCITQKHQNSVWRLIVKQTPKTMYLQDNDYIYFVSSNKSKGLLSIKMDGDNYQVQYIKNKKEDEEIYSAMFIVEIVQEDEIYLKHLLSGKYFPFNVKNQKKVFVLKPLSVYDKNKYPPFHLEFGGEFFPKDQKIETRKFNGFWLNKANKKRINEILSIKNVPINVWIPYLLNYLSKDFNRRQQLLQECQFIKYILLKVIPLLKRNLQHLKEQGQRFQCKQIANIKNMIQQSYLLIFKIYQGNQKINKESLEFITFINLILQQEDKEYIVDVLSELLDGQNTFTEKNITPEVIGYLLREFKSRNLYQLNFMRIFRLFCGSDTQPCVRNQNFIYSIFFQNRQNLYQMTQSIRQFESFTLPRKYKFTIQVKQNKIYFNNTEECKQFKEFNVDARQYIRQYYYLLSDTMKMNNRQVVKGFKDKYSRSLLIKMLYDPQLEDMKGPIINLIVQGYMETQYKYKLYIFYKDYENMFCRGSLISKKQDQSDQFLKAFMKQQISVSKDYSSTKYRHLLKMISISILNGYWNKMQDLIEIIDQLIQLNLLKQNSNKNHNNYEQINTYQNLMKCKIMSVNITILLLDLQINLWISELQHYDEIQIEGKINKDINQLQKWRIFKNTFTLCATQNSELMRKSLLLLKKFSNIREDIEFGYEEALRESKVEFLQEFANLIHQTDDQLNLSSEQICLKYINACVYGLKPGQLNKDQINSKAENSLFSIYQYKNTNQQFQTLCYKLGIFSKICNDLLRYTSLRGKQKSNEKESIFWKLLLLNAMIKNNFKLIQQVSKIRLTLIKLIQEQTEIYYVSLNILQEIYQNNRNMIVADSEQLQKICQQVVRLIMRKENKAIHRISIKVCKILYFLDVFLHVGSKKVKNNYAIVLKSVFDKDVIINLISRINLIEENISKLHKNQIKKEKENLMNLFTIIIYMFLCILEQKIKNFGFKLPSIEAFIDVIMKIGRENWNLKMKIFSLINQYKQNKEDLWEKRPMEDSNQIKMLVLVKTNLTMICQILIKWLSTRKKNQKYKELPEQFVIFKNYLPNFIQNLNVFFQTSSSFAKQMDEFQKKRNETIKIIERLYLIKVLCHPDLEKKIESMWAEIKSNYTAQYDEILNHLSIETVTIQEIKDPKPLVQIYKDNLKDKEQSKRLSIQICSKGIQLILKRKGSKIYQTQLILSQQKLINEAKPFIMSLININKTDSSFLSNDLKYFVIDFTINSFFSVAKQLVLKNSNTPSVLHSVPSIISTFLEENFKERYEMFNKMFMLGIKLLQGGNHSCQEVFLKIFQADHKNCIFDNINQILECSLSTIRFYYQYTEVNQGKQLGFHYQSVISSNLTREKKYACQLILNVFRFLQLLCENDNHSMKKYIFNQFNEDQKIKYTSINFIEVANYVLDQILEILSYNIIELTKMDKNQELENEISINLVRLPSFVLDFLIEVCQIPAFQNQLYLCNTDFFDIVQKIKKLKKANEGLIQKHGKNIFLTTQSKDEDTIFKYEMKIIILFRSLLQEQNPEIIDIVSKKLRKEHFQFFIDESLEYGGLTDVEKLKLMLQSHILSNYLQNVIDILIVRKTLKNEQKLNYALEKQNIIQELSQRIKSIEVDFKGKLTTVFFSYHPLFQLLSRATKQFFIDKSVNFNSRNEKLRDFIVSRKVIYQDIQNAKKSQSKIMTESGISLMFRFSLGLAYVILVLLFLFYSVTESGTVLDLWQIQIMRSLSLMQFFMTCVYVVIWGIVISPLTRQKLKTREILRNSSQGIAQIGKIKENILFLKQIYIEQPTSFHAVLLFTVSLLANLIEIRIYALTLFFIFTRIQLLKSILNAIRLTWKQLLVVCALAFIFSFIFGFLAINNYIKPLYENQEVDIGISQITEHCSTIISCINSMYTQKIIGETVDKAGDGSHYGRFVSDLIYWGFFQILLTNIIAAIIIDKFAEQRNIREKLQNEKKNKCFVCAADRATLQRKGIDFFNHIDNTHNIWNYFFYMYYLEIIKQITEFTGIQYWIQGQLKKGMIEWIPTDDSQKQDLSQDKMSLLLHKTLKKGFQSNMKEEE